MTPSLWDSPRHGGGRHLPVNAGPDCGHVLHGQPAGGTGVQAPLHHVLVAGHVDQVGAGRHMGPVSTAVDVLHADRAVVVGGVGETFVLLVPGQAETAGVAVCEVLRTSDPAAQTIRARREFLSAVRQSRTVETLRSLLSFSLAALPGTPQLS